MQNRLNKPINNSINILDRKLPKSDYNILTSYLQYLYHMHSNLELEIILTLFRTNEGCYQDFIQGIATPKTADDYSKKIVAFLSDRGYPIDFINQ